MFIRVSGVSSLPCVAPGTYLMSWMDGRMGGWVDGWMMGGWVDDEKQWYTGVRSPTFNRVFDLERQREQTVMITLVKDPLVPKFF